MDSSSSPRDVTIATSRHGVARANWSPLSPLTFLERAASVHSTRTSLVHVDKRYTWQETYDRCRRLASALVTRGIEKGDTVSVLSPNVPAVIESHFGVPMGGAILNTINIRLNAKNIALFFLHARTKLIIVDCLFVPLLREALDIYFCELRESGNLRRDDNGNGNENGKRYGNGVRNGNGNGNEREDGRESGNKKRYGNEERTGNEKQNGNGHGIRNGREDKRGNGNEKRNGNQNGHQKNQNGNGNGSGNGRGNGRGSEGNTMGTNGVFEGNNKKWVSGNVYGPKVVVIEPEEGEEEKDKTSFSSSLGFSWREEVEMLKNSVDVYFYEDFLKMGDPQFDWKYPVDENDAISVNYTSGTTSSPKGVVTTHRGSYLASLSNIISWSMRRDTVFLWSLPLFHCNGWCFPWAVASIGGTNVCLRQVSSKSIYDLIFRHNVTHFCGAPIVLNLLVNAPLSEKKLMTASGKSERSQKSQESKKSQSRSKVNVMTAGAAPPPSVLSAMEELGFDVLHSYGLTETYGPSVFCEGKGEWDELPLEERAKMKARQGVRYLALEGLEVMDPETMTSVEADGRTIGEVMMRGNAVMSHYLHNEKATKEAFKGGWFHSGDLAVRHPDGYIEIKDRSKDIIISGGENVSSIEVESTLYRHPSILEAAVVARPDDQWGESVCAFVCLKENDNPREVTSEEDIVNFCQQNLPRYMVPKTIIFEALPKTATGKIQKFLLREKAKALGSLSKDGIGERKKREIRSRL